MHVERLTRLAEHLEQLPEKLNMHHWRCGSAACALGHACMLPEFQEQGLSLEKEKLEGVYYYPVFLDSGELYTGFRAAEMFFDITPAQSCKLFHPGCYAGTYTDLETVDPGLVAQRIWEMLAEHAGEKIS